MSTICESSYLSNVLEPKRLRKVIKNLVKVIKEKVGVDNFDAIAYRGMSGAGVATAVGFLLGKPLIMVRKNGENSHSSMKIEGAIYSERIIVVDDCIATGSTLMRTVREIYTNISRNRMPLKVVAVVLYNDSCRGYRILTEEPIYGNKFKLIFPYADRNEAFNHDTLKTMDEMKVYNFNVFKDGNKLKVATGTNLDIEDLV
jgi:orotate phosphoribosyltransferase